MNFKKTVLKKHFTFFFILLLTNFYSNEVYSQKEKNVYVDKQGVMRWGNTKKEVKGFGVNYSVPFAHAYRSAKSMGINIKEAIDNDIYHFTRLGFDLYRLHVWDTQISDTLGNLITNEHLDTFDYLISKLKEKKINYIITPIAFWGNGWPEPDTKSPGFSHKYGKKNALINEDAIKAQQNYLFQFLNHKNPYTEEYYKEDPNLIAFEVSNEPHHRGAAKDVTKFVKKMVASMRKTGTRKPIFYNMSHAVHFAEAYFDGNIQGGTFQWYPTGLLYGKELLGNLLPNVDRYEIPFEDSFKMNKGAKLVYEFDAADVGKSYIYPAMARSFRTAGIQVATHFTYEPTYMAATNTEYNSHFMNLAYTPSKALALKICSEIFHSVSMNTSYGKYPQNTDFGNTHISYEKDLAIYNSKEKYFYTNNTQKLPKNEDLLMEIAGFGNSPLVEYNGKGAYFLDKIEEGVWRIELMPDAVSVKDPFGRNSPKKIVSVINWKVHTMKLNIKDLSESFKITAINDSNEFIPKINSTSFTIYPGTYIVSKKEVKKNWKKNNSFKEYQLKSYYAPKSNVNTTYVKHEPLKEISENTPFIAKAQIISNQEIKSVEFIENNSRQSYFNIVMKKARAYEYEVKLDSSDAKKGFINYNIVVTLADGTQRTYPAGKKGSLYDWDFYDRSSYTTQVVPSNNPIYLFNAKEDAKDLVLQWRKGFKLVPTDAYNEAEYQMMFDKLYYPDIENSNAEPIHVYSFKHFIKDKITERITDLTKKKQLVLYGKSLLETPVKIQIAFVLKNGASFGKVITLSPKRKKHIIELSELEPVKTVTLPRPYPTFLPYFFDHDISDSFQLKDIESIQISIGPGIHKKFITSRLGIGLTSIWLE